MTGGLCNISATAKKDSYQVITSSKTPRLQRLKSMFVCVSVFLSFSLSVVSLDRPTMCYRSVSSDSFKLDIGIGGHSMGKVSQTNSAT